MKISYWTKCAVTDLAVWLRWLVMACLLAGAASSALAAKTYSDNGDGTVTDPTTGLRWMRCAMGQTWDGTTCTGTVSTYTFDQANENTGAVPFPGKATEGSICWNGASNAPMMALAGSQPTEQC